MNRKLSSNMKEQIAVLKQTELLGQQFAVYGTPEEPLFRAKDVAKWIEHTNERMMLNTIDEDEKGVRIIYTPGGNQEVWMLTESGLYEVLMQSRKPIAKQFKKGVKTILHEIRTKGGYMVSKPEETPEQIMARAILLAQDTIKRQKEALENLNKQVEAKAEEIKSLQPAKIFTDAVSASSKSILIGELAKLLYQNGYKIGQRALFALLRDKGYLCKAGMSYNLPTQKAMELGLFEMKKTVITKPDGNILVNTTTKVTGKGQIYFINKFLNKKEIA